MIRSVARSTRTSPSTCWWASAAAVEATFQADLEKVKANIPYDKIDFDAARLAST